MPGAEASMPAIDEGLFHGVRHELSVLEVSLVAKLAFRGYWEVAPTRRRKRKTLAKSKLRKHDALFPVATTTYSRGGAIPNDMGAYPLDWGGEIDSCFIIPFSR